MRQVAYNSSDISNQRRYGVALAIAGVGCRFASGVRAHASFVAMSRGGRQAVVEIPASPDFQRPSQLVDWDAAALKNARDDRILGRSAGIAHGAILANRQGCTAGRNFVGES
jgi:hypothetical protein